MQKRELDGKVALVTGASSGIGRACALALADAGASVVVNYHSNRDAAQDVVTTITSRGGRAFCHGADVGDEGSVTAMFNRIRDEFGTLHILVNNAGIQRDASLLDMSLAHWQAVIETNLQGPFLCTREAAREMCRRSGDRKPGAEPIGQIVFIGSVHDLIPWAGRANYATSKAGVLMLMKTVAQELGLHGIRVNAVCPGVIKTEINRETWESEDARRRILDKVPYRRIGEPDDVARAVVWLTRRDSDYVHGHALYVDGGMLLYPGFREAG